MRVVIFAVSIFLITLAGCCKDKNLCKNEFLSIRPFIERFYIFWCNNNDVEYTYIFNNSQQIEDLRPTCFFIAPVAFPIDEKNMQYFLVGRLSYHQKDTFQTSLLKDTCSKTLVYDVSMIQRDTAYYFPDRRGGILSMYCAVENIPADYKVEVKYKYVPLP